MASPEQRIYRESPIPPTIKDLKEGLNLLLNTYGTERSIMHGQHTSVQIGRQNGVILIDRLRDAREEGECAGIKALDQVSSPIDKSAPRIFENYTIISALDLCRDLTDHERKIAGGVILKAWETLNAKQIKQSTL